MTLSGFLSANIERRPRVPSSSATSLFPARQVGAGHWASDSES
eukprot:CAMPEP_0194781140 /NCGR_PEP_ID=MMETSP0323_2-20130528/75496_1 /TAXON_ID=2866 ORGANISM="Crypthecodinium cohnii, Strain Seligo" /NCGR_SAMPLE_ID=MMETSP0323_2 /ASSEMBLY_ACC=CAM_ASM_000346 /LENGTH=42 /DNA_ID= /DNA_START= /DNA_END= /DNA_ORIENTATION=